MAAESRVDRLAGGTLLLLGHISLLSGCEGVAPPTEASPEGATRVRQWSLDASDEDPHLECRDVGHRTACFAAGGVKVVPRRVPTLAAPSALGFRCWESEGKRTCVDRLLAAGPFTCTTGEHGKTVCVQRAPRLPRGGIWDCGDDSGAVVCLGQDAPPSVDRGWKCGDRRGADAGQRVCVDLSPDYPDGVAQGWECGFEDDPRAVGGRARVCTRDLSAHVLGVDCDAKRPCVDGARCVSGACVPISSEASCIASQDCGDQKCRFGGCVARGAAP